MSDVATAQPDLNTTVATRTVTLAEAMRRAGNAERKGRLDRADQIYRQVLAAVPDHRGALRALGLVLNRLGRREEAITLLTRLVALDPSAPHHFALAFVLQESDRLAEADAAYRATTTLDPDNAEAHNNWGNTLRELGRFAEAEQAFRRALALKPDYANAHQNLGILLLLLGRLEEGWRDYHWRWRTPAITPLRRDFAQPAWDGGVLNGRTILLHCEQGHGDAIQFVRYAPLVTARGGSVILEAPRPLARLLRALRGIAQVVVRGDALPAFDCHAPLLDLPRLFGTTLDTIPAGAYLAPPAALAAKWRALIPPDGRLRVGLIWAGNPHHRNDRHRSLDPALLAPLLAVPGVAVHSLQRGAPPPSAAVVDLAPRLADFADTAAAMAQLDLIIAVDTAPAHLAGALGRPAWIMLPHVADWRWLRDRDDSPWYPGMRLFRQPARGDWPPVIAAIRDALVQRIAVRP